MYLNEKNRNNLQELFIFCHLYNSHRDFILAKNIAKHKTLSWDKAESLSDFCNMIVKTKQSTPIDFIKTEDETGNEVIEKYVILKNNLKFIKDNFGVKTRDEIYKAVKKFFRSKVYCYQMDSYFSFMVFGFYEYQKGTFSFKYFIDNYYFECSLFDGKRKDLELKKVMKMYLYIKNIINF
jgi:hypothetical protein